MSFYGSTPNYEFIWDEAGFEGTTARLREKQKAGLYNALGGTDRFERYGEIAQRLSAGQRRLALPTRRARGRDPSRRGRTPAGLRRLRYRR